MRSTALPDLLGMASNLLLSSLHLPDPDTLALRSDGSQPHPYLTVQEGFYCKHCGLWLQHIALRSLFLLCVVCQVY
ncbi:Uncharacterized protein HZ326_19942 [Fusarium oxysporum f. sp. albedinis]|nr:Uncharacterized protein HZ326_19942 [Fusarium oxysporum f. sp. albedinis]